MKFEPSNLAIYICNHVFDRSRSVLFVSHEENGDWQFLCGNVDHDSDSVHVVGIGHLIADDPSLSSLADLPVNWSAERPSANDPWLRSVLDGS